MVGRVLDPLALAGSAAEPRYWAGTQMDFTPADILFICVVIWIALELIDGDWGGGRRSRATVHG
jgi:hypothetical protein